MRGFAVDEVADGAGLAFALERLRDAGTRPDVLIADFGAPEGDELDALLPWAAERVPTIVMTGYGDGGTGTRAYARGASAVMEKPFTLRELVAQIHDLLPASARARDLVQ